ncbi:MAG: hypothetical protein ACFWTZ_08595 [Burkholderia sp.]|jgi:hypothetical protein
MAASSERPMRRKDRELTEEEALEIVRTSHYAVIATCDASGTPYAVPVSPVWIDGALYFHSAADPAGRRASNLAQNPRVSLCYLARCRSVYEPPENFHRKLRLGRRCGLRRARDGRSRAAPRRFGALRFPVPRCAPGERRERLGAFRRPHHRLEGHSRKDFRQGAPAEDRSARCQVTFYRCRRAPL